VIEPAGSEDLTRGVKVMVAASRRSCLGQMTGERPVTTIATSYFGRSGRGNSKKKVLPCRITIHPDLPTRPLTIFLKRCRAYPWPGYCDGWRRHVHRLAQGEKLVVVGLRAEEARFVPMP